MGAMTVRGLDKDTARALKRRAAQEGMSINGFVLKTIRESLGFESRKGRSYEDLDHLAGTWTDKDLREFEKNTSVFEIIDETLWK